MIRVLVKHDVEFIVVGGIAATLNGAIIATQDLDVLYALDESNVEHVMQALGALDARGSPADHNAIGSSMRFVRSAPRCRAAVDHRPDAAAVVFSSTRFTATSAQG